MEQEFWQDGTGNYLKIKGEGPESVADRMFMYQNITGFLPMEIRWINGEKEYVYDTSGKISLAHYLVEEKINKKILCHMLQELFSLSNLLQEYLLDPDGVMCHEDYIFVDRGTGRISAIFQENSSFGGIEALGKLVEYIMQKMDGKDEELALFVYGLHQRIKDRGMTLSILSDYIKKEEKTMPEKVRTEKVPHFVDRSVAVAKKQKMPQTGMGYVISGILLSAGILVTLIGWWSGWFREPVSGEYDWGMGIAFTAFFLGVTGYGAWRLWPKTREKELVYQEQERPKKACLISCQGRMPSIPIAHYPFVLGTEEERVDGVVSGTGVERIHAQIFWEENQLYVQDQESEKGTFWNDERLVPWQKRPLQDGDILRLATTEYVVEIS